MLKMIIFVLLLWQCTTRVFQTSMKLSNLGINRSWLYLDKMSFAPGTVTVKFTTIVSGIPYAGDGIVTIEAIPEHLW